MTNAISPIPAKDGKEWVTAVSTRRRTQNKGLVTIYEILVPEAEIRIGRLPTHESF